jgi:C_GCAxxG_C_C family probable redox protein
MTKSEEAVSIFNHNYNCCQAVIAVFAKELGISREVSLKLGSPFGGGACKGELCGAVSGGLMALGLKYGHYIEGDLETKQQMTILAKKFMERFEDKQDSIVCKHILGYDLTKEDERKIILEKGLFDTVCPRAVETAVLIIEDMLVE